MTRRKQKVAAESALGTPLGLRSADGSLQRVFDIQVVNSFRHMATELAYNGALPRRISLISALRGDGVTYSALALGTTLASDMQTRVCVIELNWWSPGMLRQLEPSADLLPQKLRRGQPTKTVSDAPLSQTVQRPGLAQVLNGEIALEDALIHTDQANLDLLPAGDLVVARRPTMARSDALRELIQDISQRYDHLLLDIPAILTTSDAIALASLGEACVVVVRQGVTPSSSVKHALDDVRHLTMLGVVLNQVSIATPRWLHALIPQG